MTRKQEKNDTRQFFFYPMKGVGGGQENNKIDLSFQRAFKILRDIR